MKKYKQLTEPQRYQIETYLKLGKSKAYIAKELGVHPSTIGREVKRNKSVQGKYGAHRAQSFAKIRKDRYICYRTFTINEKRIIDHYVREEQWSPKQIIGHCKKNGIPMVSHESIYAYIRQDKRNGGALYKQLRHKLKHRKRPVGKHMPIKDRISIDLRPDIINNKQRFGDWEIDTIVGANGKQAILTIVERTTNFFMMKNLPKGRNSKELSKELIEMLLPYKNSILSITSDNGAEFADHKTIAEKLETQFYFAHPYHSWERGLNENTNKLVRQYIPKRTSFTQITNQQITDIQHKINRRPREKLNFETPKNLFYKLVA